MNNFTLTLSSNTTSWIQHVSELEFDDFTQLTLKLNGVNESVIPTYVKIDWGNGDRPVIYDNDVYRMSRNEVNALGFSPVLTDIYTQNYYPSSYALYKSLSAQVLVNYTNGDSAWFVIPIKIRTYDYFESLTDVKLINSNILPLSGNPVELQLKSEKDDQTIDLISD